MAKRTSGKAYFEALGRSAASRGMPITLHRIRRNAWPLWAREAWARGWLSQPSERNQTMRIVKVLELRASESGRTVSQEVERYLGGANHG